MPRILLIDDDEILVKTLKTILEHAGHKVASALGGEEGLRLAKAEPPDLVILDVMMPGTDGLEVCRALRQDDQLCDVPVLVFTALGEHDLRAHAAPSRTPSARMISSPNPSPSTSCCATSIRCCGSATSADH